MQIQMFWLQIQLASQMQKQSESGDFYFIFIYFLRVGGGEEVSSFQEMFNILEVQVSLYSRSAWRHLTTNHGYLCTTTNRTKNHKSLSVLDVKHAAQY